LKGEIVLKKVKVALIQSHWRESPEENFKAICKMIEEIGSNGNIDLIGLPEFFMGPPWYFPGKAHLKGRVDDTVPGKITDQLARLAQKYHTYILCGTIVERENNSYFNTSVVLNDEGEIIGKARKVHCYAAELISIQAATDQLIVDTPFGKVGICVCSDFWIQEMPRMLALKGAEIIYVSGASLIQDIEITRPCILANSVHNVCYTLYTSIVGKVIGERAGIPTFTIEFGGHTTVAEPKKILATLNNEEDILYTELDMDYIRKLRQVDITFKNTLYWGLWGRRPELFSDILKPYVEAKEDLKILLEEYLH
jgi:predicted amidohydrolase